MTRDEEKANQVEAVQAIIKLTEGKARIDEVFPHVIDAHKCPSLYLEWMVEKFWGLQTPKLMVELNKCWEGLVKKRHTEKKKFDFNDCDDKAWYMPCRTHRVMCHTSQNFNHLYVWETPRYPNDKPDLHIRRFYDIYDKERHSWSDDKDLMTVQEAINKKAKFQMKYGDGRDEGYVCSYNGWKGDVHWAMSTHTELKVIHECFIPNLCCCLFEDHDKQVANTIGGHNDEKGYDSWPKVEYNL